MKSNCSRNLINVEKNAEESEMLHQTQERIPKKVPQIKYTLICCFSVNFPPQTRMLCLLWLTSFFFFSKQNHYQPAATLDWAKRDTFQACEMCLFRCSCSTGTQNTKHAPDHPCKPIVFQFFLLIKSKGKRTPSHPNGLSCAHAQVCHVTHSSGKRTTGLKIAPNFTSCCGIRRYSYIQTISSIRKCHSCLFAHFQGTLLQIISFHSDFGI